MYQQYIWMDIVCRDDEKKEPGRPVPFFRDFKTSLSANIPGLFAMFLFALY